MNTKQVYSNMTNINLDEQRKIWDERGKGYYGEYIVFKELFENIDGHSKFLMNLEIPTTNDRTTEIDLLMIHETGIYSFEIKHYKGTIYGKPSDSTWTQYFRTQKNSVFNNPISQNIYHIQALKNLFPNIAIHNIVVFSNEDCVLKIERDNNSVVSSLRNLHNDLMRYIYNQPPCFNTHQIESIFQTLEPYSPLSKRTVAIPDSQVISFYEYIHSIKTSLQDSRASYKNSQDLLDKQIKRSKKQTWIALAVTVLAGLIAVYFACSTYKAFYNNKLNEEKEACESKVEEAMNTLHSMEQNFQKVDLTDPNNFILADGMLTVVPQLQMSTDLVNTANFTCTIIDNAEEYGIIIGEDSRYIVLMKDGTSHEYKMFGKHNSYSTPRICGKNGKIFYRQSLTLKTIEIYDIADINEIDYIKITDVSLWKYGENSNNPLVNDLELELYSK